MNDNLILILEGFLLDIPVEPDTLDDWEDMLEIDCLRSYQRDWNRHWKETRSKLFAASYREN